MSDIMYVTKETLEIMKAELQHLKSVERPAASRAIAEAREKGDLKENAEYDAAKEAQGILEAKIASLQEEFESVTDELNKSYIEEDLKKEIIEKNRHQMTQKRLSQNTTNGKSK